MRLLIGVSMLALAVALPAQAATIEVRPGQSIGAALKQAKAGDTVAVRAGTYNETIYARVSGVKLVSADGAGAAKIVSSGTPIFLQGGSNNEIRGFRLVAGAGGNGIQVGGTVSDYASGYVVSDNIIESAGEDGIKVHQARGFTIEGNTIERSGLKPGNSNRDGGIDFVAVTGSKLVANEVLGSNGDTCMMLKGGSSSNTISDNTFTGCKDSIHVGGLTKDQFAADNREAYNNTITGNQLCGTNAVYMFDGEKRRKDNTLGNNSCDGAQVGPTATALPTRADIPKVPLPDNSKQQAIANAAVAGLGVASKVLAQATATKMPSMSLEQLRQQMADQNKANCN